MWYDFRAPGGSKLSAEFMTLLAKTKAKQKNLSGPPIFITFSKQREGILRKAWEMSKTFEVTSKTSHCQLRRTVLSSR